MKTVQFTDMKNGTKEDYLLLQEHQKPFTALTANRVLRELGRQAEDTLSGYQVTRLDHSLQTATRALHDGADDDWVASALLHDIGDGLAPHNHDRFAAEVLRPFLREECVWVVEHHGTFQMIYYAHHYGWNPLEREKYGDSPYYQTCVDFCERWDQTSFDPKYRSEPLETFVPLVQRLFARKPYDPAVLQPGVVTGLPPLRAAAE